MSLPTRSELPNSSSPWMSITGRPDLAATCRASVVLPVPAGPEKLIGIAGFEIGEGPLDQLLDLRSDDETVAGLGLNVVGAVGQFAGNHLPACAVAVLGHGGAASFPAGQVANQVGGWWDAIRHATADGAQMGPVGGRWPCCQRTSAAAG